MDVWTELLDRIEGGYTTGADADLARDLLDKVAECEGQMQACGCGELKRELAAAQAKLLALIVAAVNLSVAHFACGEYAEVTVDPQNWAKLREAVDEARKPDRAALDAALDARDKHWRDVLRSVFGNAWAAFRNAMSYGDFIPEPPSVPMLAREIGELSNALAGKHEHPPEYELAQIAGIAINWLRMLGVIPKPRRDITVRLAEARREGAEAAADVLRNAMMAYPESIFTPPPPGKHGDTVDACSAAAIRGVLPALIDAIEKLPLEAS
jgi:hypothetical protein